MTDSQEKLYDEILQNPGCVDDILQSRNTASKLSLVAIMPRLPNALEVAFKLLSDEAKQVRLALIGYIERLPESYELCLRLADDPDGNVRWALSREVHRIPYGAEIAKHMVTTDTSEHSRWAIAKQLDQLENGEELANLLIADPEPFVREEVIKNLGALDFGPDLAKRVAQSADQGDRLMLASNINTMTNQEELETLLKKRSTGGIRNALFKQLQIRERLRSGLPATGSIKTYRSPHDIAVRQDGGRIRYARNRQSQVPMGRSRPLR